MKKLHIFGVATILTLFFVSPAIAEKKNSDELSIVVPADSIARFIKPLLPYRIDFGENFSGSIWVKSIKNIKIKDL